MLALITGATGFVGRAVCSRFLSAGWQVRGVARHLPPNPAGLTAFRQLDLQRDDLSQAVIGADIVIHLAGLAHQVHENQRDVAAYHCANVEASLRLAEAAKKCGVPRLLFMSTAKVHGESSPGRAFVENDAPQPQDAYARSKWEAEQRLTEIFPDLTVIRPPLVYGPEVRANFLRMLHLLDRGIPLPLASVKNSRSLVFVHNLADAVYTCSTVATSGPYLISDQEDISTPALLMLLSRNLGRQARLWPCPPLLIRVAGRLCGRSYESDRLLGSFLVNSSRITRDLGWRPPYTLALGLKQTTDWFQSPI